MKALLNLIAIAALAAIGVGIWMLGPPGTDIPAAAPQPDPAPVADTIPDDPLPQETAPQAAEPEPSAGGFTVEGVQPGYFIPGTEIRFNDLVLGNIHAAPAGNGFEEMVMVMLEDTSEVAGTNDWGDYYETVPMTVESYTIAPEGLSITATHPDLGTMSIAGAWQAQGYADWTSGADAVDLLFTADVTLEGVTLEDVPFSFWIGD